MKELKFLQNTNNKNANIINFYGSTTYKDENTGTNTLLLLLEYCEYGNIFDFLEKNNNSQKLNENQILQVISNINNALIYIHNQGLVHSDIKMENILVTNNFSFKLCDFGSLNNYNIILNEISEHEYVNLQTIFEKETTLMYRPPEMIIYNKDYAINKNVDTWMLGCVLYTLMFFRHPFFESNKFGIYSGKYIVKEHGYSTKLELFMRNMLTTNPNLRYTSQDITNILQNWNTVNINLNVILKGMFK